MHSLNNRSGKTSGGVSIFSHENFNFEILTDLSNFFSKGAETLFMQINKFPISTNEKIVLGVIYCLPQLPITPFLEDLDKLLMELDEMNAIYHLVGDYNIGFLSYPPGQKASGFNNTFMTHSAFSILSQPTRVTKLTNSLTDNFIQ